MSNCDDVADNDGYGVGDTDGVTNSVTGGND